MRVRNTSKIVLYYVKIHRKHIGKTIVVHNLKTLKSLYHRIFFFRNCFEKKLTMKMIRGCTKPELIFVLKYINSQLYFCMKKLRFVYNRIRYLLLKIESLMGYTTFQSVEILLFLNHLRK